MLGLLDGDADGILAVHETLANGLGVNQQVVNGRGCFRMHPDWTATIAKARQRHWFGCQQGSASGGVPLQRLISQPVK